MHNLFETVIQNLYASPEPFFDAHALLDEKTSSPERIAQSLTAAFLLGLAGDDTGSRYLAQMAENPEWGETTEIFIHARRRIEKEIQDVVKDPDFAENLKALADAPSDITKLRKVFFPEGAGLPEERAERERALRAKRNVKITLPNPVPISDPGRELLFTSNVLLTVPDSLTPVEKSAYADALQAHIVQAVAENQIYWYDHPIQVGVEPESNEILYGLRGLDEAVAFERARGNMPGERITCVLSTSVTHEGLHRVAKEYIETEIVKQGGFKNVDVFVFTEADTRRLINEVLAPAAKEFLNAEQSVQILEVFGVDGEYGRHYSFLKAISALWNVLKDPQIKATFKIDLDQVFPQKELVEQSGASAFEHFKTPLWGARGTDADGRTVELGMIAGALVNEKDIHKGLFTPDVPFPNGTSTLEDRIFFSRLLMALSTEGELMTRYGGNAINGESTCIQRIHVTGGTNGILVDSLQKHRPFTPSFIGRAEDQAYILSVLMEKGEKLGYIHEDGLIMRHDKEAFAAAAIKAASFGNLIGDYIRTLYFSAYARALNEGDIGPIKDIVDPFTGCFISRIPITVVMLRLCMKAAGFFLAGEETTGKEFVLSSMPRLARAMSFSEAELRQQYLREREGWILFYDTLAALADALQEREAFAEDLRNKALDVIDQCHICAEG